jgi:hypothetical protein
MNGLRGAASDLDLGGLSVGLPSNFLAGFLAGFLASYLTGYLAGYLAGISDGFTQKTSAQHSSGRLTQRAFPWLDPLNSRSILGQFSVNSRSIRIHPRITATRSRPFSIIPAVPDLPESPWGNFTRRTHPDPPLQTV